MRSDRMKCCDVKYIGGWLVDAKTTSAELRKDWREWNAKGMRENRCQYCNRLVFLALPHKCPKK